MRYYLDTEFIEDGKTIDLISIGIVAEDGRCLYACSTDADLSYADDWVRENVIKQLPQRESSVWMNREQIRDLILSFVSGDNAIEFWAYFADYDWVAFCQLFGRMIDLPKGFPMFCRDVKQVAVGFPESVTDQLKPNNDAEHDALADASWTMKYHERLERFKRGHK
jgi:hypothetical protein